MLVEVYGLCGGSEIRAYLMGPGFEEIPDSSLDVEHNVVILRRS